VNRETGAEADVSVRAVTGRFYRPELDVLRFVAFFMVYLTHTIPYGPDSPHWMTAFSKACGFGVPVFFALSAYLITELLTIEKRRTSSISTEAFYLRRIFRIWPLYFPMLIGVFIISRLHSWAIPTFGLIAYTFFIGNWYTSHHDYLPQGFGPLWSISVEEQFYLVWPLLIRYGSRRALGIICSLGWVGSQVALVSLCLQHTPIEPAIWTNSLTHLQYFALGAGVSLLLNGSVPKIQDKVRFVMISAAMLLFFAPGYILDSGSVTEFSSISSTYPEFLLAGAAITLVLVGFLGSSVLAGGRSLRYLGKISYGLYLFHLPCLLLLWKISRHFLNNEHHSAVSVLGLPLTIGISSISYRYFESPLLRMKERFEIVKSRET
jgi:peptidoglycan/LPS O-acetylase OafA/YrhL